MVAKFTESDLWRYGAGTGRVQPDQMCPEGAIYRAGRVSCQNTSRLAVLNYSVRAPS